MTLPIERDALEYALRQLTPCHFRALKLHVQGSSFEMISHELVLDVGGNGTAVAWQLVRQAQQTVKIEYDHYLEMDDRGRAF